MDGRRDRRFRSIGGHMALFSTLLLVAGSALQASEASDARRSQRDIDERNRRKALRDNVKARRAAAANQRRLTGAIQAEAALSGAAGNSSALGAVASVEAQTGRAIGNNFDTELTGISNLSDQVSIQDNQRTIQNIGAAQSIVSAGSGFASALSENQKANAAEQARAEAARQRARDFVGG